MAGTLGARASGADERHAGARGKREKEERAAAVRWRARIEWQCGAWAWRRGSVRICGVRQRDLLSSSAVAAFDPPRRSQ